MAMGMRGGGMRGGGMHDGGRQSGMKPSEKPEMFDDGNRPGWQEMPGNGERPFEPGGAQGQGNTLMLLGISIMALLSGLFMAMKIKY